MRDKDVLVPRTPKSFLSQSTEEKQENKARRNGSRRLTNDRQMNLKSQIIDMILKSMPDCLAIYRFGSWGTVDERYDSDLDLAILPSAPTDNVKRWELAQKLACIVGRDVDLVDLLTASTVLRMQVLANGERLYCSASEDVEIFEDLVYTGYARLNEERSEILDDIRVRGSVYAK